MTHWQVNSAEEAYRLMESEVPEIVLLQALQQDNWELCFRLKQQRHLLWSYCILLDDRPCPEVTSSTESLLRQAGLVTTALETGADAYLWVPPLLGDQEEEPVGYLNRLIQAHIRAAMRRIQAYRELSQTNDLLSAIALIDPLTQLGNRRAMDWELPRQIQAAREQQIPLSLLILDIDYFKQVNDQHGHLVGDEVLRLFAERLRHNMRFYETPFRYGGEEFVVILQNASNEEARNVAERLRRLIRDTPFALNDGLDLPITISVGAATLTDLDDQRGVDLLARADDNLLKAKAGGRNQVIVS